MILLVLQATKRADLLTMFLKLSQDLFGQAMMKQMFGDMNALVNNPNMTAILIDELDMNQTQCVAIEEDVPYYIPEYLTFTLYEEPKNNNSQQINPTVESIFVQVVVGSKASISSFCCKAK